MSTNFEEPNKTGKLHYQGQITDKKTLQVTLIKQVRYGKCIKYQKYAQNMS